MHLAWSALVIAGVSLLLWTDASAPCPPGGPLDFGDCAAIRPFVVGIGAAAATLYVLGLSAVLWWVAGLRARRVADVRAARDWYLLAAGIGLPAAPLLAFTLLSALR